MDRLALNSKRPTCLFPRCWNSRYIPLSNHVRLDLGPETQPFRIWGGRESVLGYSAILEIFIPDALGSPEGFRTFVVCETSLTEPSLRDYYSGLWVRRVQ